MLWVVPCCGPNYTLRAARNYGWNTPKIYLKALGSQHSSQVLGGQVPRKERGLGRRPTFSDPLFSSSVRRVSWAEVLAGQGAAMLHFCSCHEAGRPELDFRACWGIGPLISIPEFQGESERLLCSSKRELETHQLCTKIETSFITSSSPDSPGDVPILNASQRAKLSPLWNHLQEPLNISTFVHTQWNNWN